MSAIIRKIHFNRNTFSIFSSSNNHAQAQMHGSFLKTHCTKTNLQTALKITKNKTKNKHQQAKKQTKTKQNKTYHSIHLLDALNAYIMKEESSRACNPTISPLLSVPVQKQMSSLAQDRATVFPTKSVREKLSSVGFLTINVIHKQREKIEPWLSGVPLKKQTNKQKQKNEKVMSQISPAL